MALRIGWASAWQSAAFMLPEVAALLGLAILYLNLPDIAVTFHGMSASWAGAAILVLVVALAVRMARREPVMADRPLLLQFALLGIVLLSTFGVQDFPVAISWITTFLLEGILLYFVVSNLFRTWDRLQHALVVLLICGALLGALTIYQEATRSYENPFSGLAQRNLEYTLLETKAPQDPLRPAQEIHVSSRAGGPVGQPNRYAQILLVLLPIAYFAARRETRRWLRFALYGCGAIILGGVLLTYSRGAFLSVLVIAALLVITRALRLRTLALVSLVLIATVIAWTRGDALRVATLQETPGLLVKAEGKAQGPESEEVMRYRSSEMRSAWSVFVDHPLLGVGPGQFGPVYSPKYRSRPETSLEIGRARPRNLYFELAAETGILGLACFLAIVGWIQLRLWRAWRRWRNARDDLAGLALGFFIAICGYLVSAVFLHLSYQRYYWLLLGLAAAAHHIIQLETARAERLQRRAQAIEAGSGAMT